MCSACRKLSTWAIIRASHFPKAQATNPGIAEALEAKYGLHDPVPVRQGDYLAKLAHDMGFDADQTWNDPKNEDLRKIRKPNLLLPGDLLWVPDTAKPPQPLAGGTTNDYAANVPTIQLKLAFKNDAGIKSASSRGSAIPRT